MKRELKFRAWDKSAKQMSPEFDLFGEFTLLGAMHDWQMEIAPDRGVGTLELLNELEVMQFTGLHDKNGKDIYEGDIIAHERRSKPYSDKCKKAMVKCVVYWNSALSSAENKSNPSSFNNNPGFWADPIDRKAKESGWAYDWSEFHNCEVLGNIHENPYLLEK